MEIPISILAAEVLLHAAPVVFNAVTYERVGRRGGVSPQHEKDASGRLSPASSQCPLGDITKM